MNNITAKIGSFFEDLEFEKDEHRYNVGKQYLSSVSKLINSFHYPFQRDKISSDVAFRRNVEQKEVLALKYL